MLYLKDNSVYFVGSDGNAHPCNITAVDKVVTKRELESVTYVPLERTVTLPSGASQVTLESLIAKFNVSELNPYEFPEGPESCKITAYAIGDADGEIDDTGDDGAISVTVPAETDVTALVATFEATVGAKVKVGTKNQVSGTTENDFTSPVTYKVTSQDGSPSRNYVVAVTVAEPEEQEPAEE